jgi:hypothetical protein
MVNHPARQPGGRALGKKLNRLGRCSDCNDAASRASREMGFLDKMRNLGHLLNVLVMAIADKH